MNIIYANLQNFKSEIETGKILLDFYAEWCPPCKMLSPVLDEIASENPDLKIVKVDIDKFPEIAKTFGVVSVPTIFYIKDATVEGNVVGFQPKDEFLKLIK